MKKRREVEGGGRKTGERKVDRRDEKRGKNVWMVERGLDLGLKENVAK